MIPLEKKRHAHTRTNAYAHQLHPVSRNIYSTRRKIKNSETLDVKVPWELQLSLSEALGTFIRAVAAVTYQHASTIEANLPGHFTMTPIFFHDSNDPLLIHGVKLLRQNDNQHQC